MSQPERSRDLLIAAGAFAAALAGSAPACATEIDDRVAGVSQAQIEQHVDALTALERWTVDGQEEARGYVRAALESYGYAVTTDGAGNVVAELTGEVEPDRIFVLGAHYDSVEGTPGADDNASGVAGMLEVARVLKDHPQAATIEFAWFTGEEAGLRGSREYVRRAVADGKKIVGALNNDMIGWTRNYRLDNTIRYSNPGIRDVQHGEQVRREARLGRVVGGHLSRQVNVALLAREVAAQRVQRARLGVEVSLALGRRHLGVRHLGRQRLHDRRALRGRERLPLVGARCHRIPCRAGSQGAHTNYRVAGRQRGVKTYHDSPSRRATLDAVLRMGSNLAREHGPRSCSAGRSPRIACTPGHSQRRAHGPSHIVRLSRQLKT